MSRSDELLDEVAAYADRLAKSDDLADTGSMTTAEALAELYEKREWVDEWLEQKPIKPKKTYIGGKAPDPDNRSRFAAWMTWKLGDRLQINAPTARVRVYQLLEAHEVASHVVTSGYKVASERVLRPLKWLRKNKYADRIPEVWKRAIELAGSADAVTSKHTRDALNEWKKDTLSPKELKATTRAKRAETHRTKAQTYVQQLFADGDQDEAERFHQWYIDFLRERQQSEAKAA